MVIASRHSFISFKISFLGIPTLQVFDSLKMPNKYQYRRFFCRLSKTSPFGKGLTILQNEV